MANPPFAGDIKENTIISRYELGKKSNGKWQNKVGRDILFIERNLNFLAPGGRMAIVLPQGRFNNSSDKYIRDFIAEHCRTLLVLFKSEAIQELLKQRCSGTILTSINKDEFLSLPLPKIDEDIQAKISEQIKESFALRRKSKQLLEDAKRAVEIAIEQDEESAIEWLKDRVDL